MKILLYNTRIVLDFHKIRYANIEEHWRTAVLARAFNVTQDDTSEQVSTQYDGKIILTNNLPGT